MLTTLSDNITTNGLYTYNPPTGYDGFSSAEINVNVSSLPNLTPGSATITSNGTTEYNPPANSDGFSSFTVTTNVPSSELDYDSITLYNAQTINSEYTVLNNVSADYSGWTYFTPVSGAQTVVLPAYSYMFVIPSEYRTIAGNQVGQIRFFVNGNNVGTQIPFGVRIRYCIFSGAAQGTNWQYMFSVNAGSDPMAWSDDLNPREQGNNRNLHLDIEDLTRFYQFE